MEHTDLRESVTARVIEVISANQHSAPGVVKEESTFLELGIDSLDGLHILFALEEEFNLDIPDDAAREFSSVRQVVDGVITLLERKSAAAIPA